MTSHKPGYLEDERLQRELRDNDRRKLQQQREDLIAVMRIAAGRRWIYRLLFAPELGGLECGAFDHAVKDGLAAALHHAHMEGARGLARAVMAEAQEACPHFYLEMIQEQVARQLAEAEERRRIQTAGEQPS